jgi:hypothetical protein
MGLTARLLPLVPVSAAFELNPESMAKLNNTLAPLSQSQIQF